MATTRLERNAVWNTISFTLNGIMFVLLGEQLPRILQGAIATVQESGRANPWWLVMYAVTITAGLAVLRLIWVWLSLQVRIWRQRHKHGQADRPSWRLIVATSLAGVRGTITLAGILTLPLLMSDGTPFPVRDLAIFLAAAVILLSLVLASVGLPRLLKGLELPSEPLEQQETDRARLAAAKAAIESIKQAQHDIQEHTPATEVDLCADAASRVIAIYQRRVSEDGVESSDEAEYLRQADAVERKLRVTGLRAERAKILELARHRRISDTTSRKLVREIDLVESIYP